jgi:alkanesulfonate monooxygenase SsuD/methylene tetrahydromethanopterin reductase-like flavin-dependent oxidoreductase (luciferase family)
VPDHPRLTFGIKTSQAGPSYGDILKTWCEADQIPAIEHAWLWDHMVPLRGDVRGPALEAWTLLAALAAQTSRLRLGVIVTSNRLRPPAVLAKMAATVDIIAGGRLDFGVGIGGTQQRDPALSELVHREYDAYGIGVVPPADGVAAFAEACTIFRRLWTETEPFDFDGQWYRLRGAVCEPKPVQRPHPPIMIGAAGERRALRVTAEHADIWNCPTRGDVAEFRRKSEVLDGHCAAIGRDPREITRSVQLIIRPGASGTGAGAGAGARASGPGLPPVNDATAARDLLLEFIAAGARHLVLAPVPPYPGLRWLAEEIIDPVREQAGTL